MKSNEPQTFNIYLYYHYLLFEIIFGSAICDDVILWRHMKYQVFLVFLANFGAKLWLKDSWVLKTCYLCYATIILHLSWKFQLCSTYHSKIIDRKLAKFSENWKISQKTGKIVFVIALEFEKQSTPNFQNVFILVNPLI